jgi:hypothetical protein
LEFGRAVLAKGDAIVKEFLADWTSWRIDNINELEK